ncbi:hypothetical protein Sros01_59930 [Streptomyces roseochromogenus]|nr:hypothetical protein Sros01_59930 [Streptomyces roseochromogenus]
MRDAAAPGRQVPGVVLRPERLQPEPARVQPHRHDEPVRYEIPLIIVHARTVRTASTAAHRISRRARRAVRAAQNPPARPAIRQTGGLPVLVRTGTHAGKGRL